MPLPSRLALVYDSTERFEQAGRALDLLEDHELLRVVGEVELGLSQASFDTRG